MKKHLFWIPTTYFMQGLTFALILILTSIFYKSMHISNEKIAFYTSVLLLPWSLKPFISPIFENLASKRSLTIFTQLGIGCCLFILAALLNNSFFITSLVLFLLIAFLGSIHDISSDGAYLLNLTNIEQANFVGIRTLFFQAARFVIASGLVVLSGILIQYTSVINTWKIVFLIPALIAMSVSLYHSFTIPKCVKDISKQSKRYFSFTPVLKETLNTKHLLVVILFLFIFNMPEAQLIKIVPLFLMDTKLHGGLHLSNIDVGIIYGGFGIISVILGAVLAGKYISRKSVKKTLLPLCLLTVLSNLTYLLLHFTLFQSFKSVALIVCIAQFGFGISNSAYMTYLLSCCNNRSYQMSLYAFGTAVMALGMALAGSLSGWLQFKLGYFNFFIWIILFGLFVSLLTYKTVRLTLK